MGAAYSVTPLAAKLGIKPASVLAVIDDPGHFLALVDPLPPNVALRTSARGKASVAVFFADRIATLERRIDSLGRLVFPSGAVWVCWPKKASNVDTDMSEDAIRSVVLERGLVDVKVAAIDQTWSGLEIVWRREARGS
jgi:hypothetical protein